MMVAGNDHPTPNREPHGRRTQRKVIGYIAAEMEHYYAFGGDEEMDVLQGILQDCHSKICPDVRVRTL